MRYVLLDGENADIVRVVGEETRVKDGLERPCALHTGGDQVPASRDIGIVLDGLDHDAEVVEVILLVVPLGTVAVAAIYFVSVILLTYS